MPTETKSSKKVQLDKNKTMIFAIVSVASVIAVGALVISKGIWSQASYLGKVADKKETALKQLQANKESVDTLKAAYETFINQNPNELGGNPAGTGELDGTNATLVLDALPSKYDFPALTSSVERLLAGHTINAITGQDDSQVQAAATSENGAVEMPFGLDVTTTYDGFKQLVDFLNKSIRPFQIVKVELSGSNSKLQANVEAKTFYQPERGLKVEMETVQ